MLYPQENSCRLSRSLDGIWRFKRDEHNSGFDEAWFSFPLLEGILMPVPSSYNDITQDVSLRDHVGWVWYEREIEFPPVHQHRCVVIRFGSATHHAVVWIDGQEVAQHTGGYLPFQADITDLVQKGGQHRLTVAVSNLLNWRTLPPGLIETHNDPCYPTGFQTQIYYHDFFNYAGLHRPIRLIDEHKVHIEDIAVQCRLKGINAALSYQVETSEYGEVNVVLRNDRGDSVGESIGSSGDIEVQTCQPWTPENPYLYSFEVQLHSGKELLDLYRLPFGIRTVVVEEDRFLLNGEPFYFKGFGKHEDADIRGKGYDDVTTLKDVYLLKWIGANSVRTSHYPYSEEFMNLADKMGLAIIDESPAVGLWNPHERVFVEQRADRELLRHHMDVLSQMVARDKNHPSVFMWSAANEPACWEKGARSYFEKVVAHIRKLDRSRPITVALVGTSNSSRIVDLLDVVSINRYYSWYTDCGRLDVIKPQLTHELEAMYTKSGGKPLIVSEYGADAIAGLHQNPPVMFSEEYQTAMLAEFHEVFDSLDYVVGEHVWSFSDFQCKQEIRRVDGNKKGVFTRDRRPKAAAHALRKRWRVL